MLRVEMCSTVVPPLKTVYDFLSKIVQRGERESQNKFKIHLTWHLWFHSDSHTSHGEEREDGLVEALVLKEVSSEVN